MRERDTLSRELNDLNKPYFFKRPDLVSIVSEFDGKYKNSVIMDCYSKLNFEIRKKLNIEVDEEFRKLTGFIGKLPPVAKANADEKILINTWFRIMNMFITEKKLCRYNIGWIMPSKNLPTITMEDLIDFEKLGGVTLSSHGSSLTTETLHHRHQNAIQGFWQDLSKIGYVSDDYKKRIKEEQIISGVEWPRPGILCYATKWASNTIMIDTINRAISGSAHNIWYNIFMHHNFTQELVFSGKDVSLGDGYIFNREPENQSFYSDKIYNMWIEI